MADIEFLTATVLPVTLDSCQNCSNIAEIGQNPGVNGSFFSHLASSLKQIRAVNNSSAVDGGELLPFDGNILPNDQIDIANDIIKQGIDTLPSQNPTAQLINSPDEETLIASSSKNDSIDTVIPRITLDALQVNKISSSAISSPAILQPNSTVKVDSNTLSIPNIQVVLNEVTTDQNLQLQSNLQRNELHVLNDKPTITLNKLSVTEGINSRVLETQIKQNANDLRNIFNIENLNKLTSSNNFENIRKNFQILNEKPIIENDISKSINLYSKADISAQNTSINPINNLISTQNLNTTQVETPYTLFVKPNPNINSDGGSNPIEQSLIQNIRWAIGNKHQNATINVYPESLGQVNVSLNLDDTKLSINFLASSPIAKEIIEGNLISLRDHLIESGINLKEVNINTRFNSESDLASNHSSDEMQDRDNKNTNLTEETNLLDINTAETNNFGLTDKAITLHLIDAYV